MAIQKKTKKPTQISFNKAHLTKVIKTLRFEVSIREKPDKTRTPYMHLAVKADVKHFSNEEVWLLKMIVEHAQKGGFNVQPSDEMLKKEKIDINDPGIFD